MKKNLEIYNSKNVVNWYLHLKEILPVERDFFEKRSEILKTAKVLDIGIGGGRTTTYLLEKCKHYTGIDYSENFVSASKQRFPESDIRLMDARNLSSFAEDTFDLVNFSFNGLDYVDLEGRTKCLLEIQRVLKPDGLFFFSTHNRGHISFGRAPWLLKQNSFIINLKTFLKLLPFLHRKLKNRKFEKIDKDYAIVNDPAHDYRLWTFYSSITFLKEQLNNSGFKDLVLYSRNGLAINDNNEAEDWIFVECRKAWK